MKTENIKFQVLIKTVIGFESGQEIILGTENVYIVPC